MEDKLQFNPALAAAAQIQYCGRKQLPMFAPYSGHCPRCGRNIYDQITTKYGGGIPGYARTGYSVEAAGKMLITGCPHCHATFVD